ncbi:Uncharacterized protein APZ42_017855 [Daphnia magna]|uniref:Uncharacterized protein n=1 Tax=Daphnia magna TaxID=35525 RepID=A0A164ZIS3_9CRUS|nr:Uncharacterized protein APZ42_017855 [Daphnia magna]
MQENSKQLNEFIFCFKQVLMTSRNFSMVSYAYTACWDATLKQAQGKSLLRPDLGGAFYTGRRSRDELYFQCRPPLDSVLSTKSTRCIACRLHRAFSAYGSTPDRIRSLIVYYGDTLNFHTSHKYLPE